MVNKAYVNFLTRSKEEILGKTDFELLPRKLARQCRDSDKRALDQGKSITEIEENPESEKVFESIKFPVRLDEDKLGVGGFIRDITERRRIKAELKSQHEKLDGSGYPDGLEKDELSLSVRILGAVDVVEAMSTRRPYRAARTKEETLNEMKSGRGIKYDPKVVDILVDIIEEDGIEFG